ncbi:MAG: DUF4240 domain-containing protein [Litoreibacter sp.]|nr:DUF4240 domain-containing protein [Litoreibacter sp.]
MLSREITDLLDIEFKGLFEDQNDCMLLLAEKRDSGDPDTPAALLEAPIFNLSPDLFIWVTQKHFDNNSAHLVAKDVMSNVSSAGLSGSYGTIVDMLASAGHKHRGAQIWRADIASHMEVYREFLRAHNVVSKYNAQPDGKASKTAPNRFQISMAKQFPEKKEVASSALDAFEQWLSKYGITADHHTQIAKWREELENGAKSKLPAAEKTPMSEELFWSIIHDAQCSSESETLLKIEDRLTAFTPKAIRDAAKFFQSSLTASYCEDIWALAYVLQDGCSDDSFEDFRCWMVLRGRDLFETIVASPDAFDPQYADGASFSAAGGLPAAFENAYLARAGKPLILPRVKYPSLEPNEEKFLERVPNVRAKLNGS